MARYLHCTDCGLTRLAPPASIPGTCPSCRSSGRTVYLTELEELPRRSRSTSPARGTYADAVVGGNRAQGI
jgi:hypothetical protein